LSEVGAGRSPCVEGFLRVVGRAIGGLSFEEAELLFREGLGENPVFAEVDRRGVLGKNVVVVLGGKGCGKTMMLRYLKHRLAGLGWDFRYASGTGLASVAREQAEAKLQELLGEVERAPAERRVAVALDDAHAVEEVAEELLKRGVELARRHEGRVKLIVSAQSGRQAFKLLRKALTESHGAGELFGENPWEAVAKELRRGQAGGGFVALYRGAVVVNLDAYWLGLRSLNNVKKLASTIVEVARFYARNAPEYCEEAVKLVEDASTGLAMIALSTPPKVVADPESGLVVLVESADPKNLSLNGAGIATLLHELFYSQELAEAVEEAKRLYEELARKRQSVSAGDVEKALLKATKTAIDTHIHPLEGVPAKAIAPLPVKRYGPVVNALEVNLGAGAVRRIALASLKLDSKGYVTTGSLERVRALAELGVPNKDGERYLAVFIPKEKGVEALYRVLGYEHIRRVDVDVIPVLESGLSGLEETFIRELLAETLPERFAKELAPRILLHTLLLSLKDHRREPRLAQLLLPPSHESPAQNGS